ncbi:MAG: hypothetical protein ACK5KU_04970, partial [Beutenbergiaceae bacterium]
MGILLLAGCSGGTEGSDSPGSSPATSASASASAESGSEAADGGVTSDAVEEPTAQDLQLPTPEAFCDALDRAAIEAYLGSPTELRAQGEDKYRLDRSCNYWD